MNKLIQKLRRIRNDHWAMNIVRKAHGDIKLVAIATNDGTIYECEAWQYDDLKGEDKDPALSIIKTTIYIDYMKGLGLNL